MSKVALNVVYLIQINADVNGALQILRKVVPNAFADGIDGIGLVPVKLNLNF